MKRAQLRKFSQMVKDVQRIVQMRQRRERTELGIVGSASEDLEPEEQGALQRCRLFLRYARGRKVVPEEFYALMNECMGVEKLRKTKDLEALADFLEGVWANYTYFSANIQSE